MPPRFVQIHFLTAWPAVLLNRDDVGMSKRLPFGGVTRTRVSSQCLKRHWRTFEGRGGLHELGLPETVRSRYTFEQFVVQPLLEGRDEAVVRRVAEEVMTLVVGNKEKAKGKKDGPELLKTGQVTVLGRPEVEYLRELVARLVEQAPDPKKVKDAVKAALDKQARDNLGRLGQSGLSAAMFGRMVTSDILARGDAAVHVAHAFTVHEQEDEPDYFSAVDDLQAEIESEEGAGSGHIGSNELTSGLFYGYVVVDVPLLVSNLTGCDRKAWLSQDRSVAAGIVGRMTQLAATVTPGAKLGSTAPHSYAQAILVEGGDEQPRTLGNAFLRPVRAGRSGMVTAALDQLTDYVQRHDAVYPSDNQRALVGLEVDAAMRARVGALTPESLPALRAWIEAAVGSAA